MTSNISDYAWKGETEKKYRLPGAEALAQLRQGLESAGCVLLHDVTQRDWVPDYEDGRMKKQGVLLRIRQLTYHTGHGPAWVVTLKRQRVVRGVHRNQELEAVAGQTAQIQAVQAELAEMTGDPVDIGRLISEGDTYAAEIGLTAHRMLLEKRRKEYRSPVGDMLFVLDELPQPLGYFIELEAQGTDARFGPWEHRLGLGAYQVMSADYGELVKKATGSRTLTF